MDEVMTEAVQGFDVSGWSLAIAKVDDGYYIDPQFLTTIYQACGDCFFVQLVIAALLVMILGAICFLAFRMR